jgi:D-glycero-D-manno-heptose 1,7-bisphosphate phosphatase
MQPEYIALDRDGTIIEERCYLHDPGAVELVPGALEALLRLRTTGARLLLITNQAGVGRGYYSMEDVDAVHARLQELLRAGGVTFDGVYVCPHAPGEGCLCRKPAPGMLEAAQREYGLDLARGVVVGDKACDIDLARNVGAVPILVRTGHGKEEEASAGPRAAFVADDLSAATEYILQNIIR